MTSSWACPNDPPCPHGRFVHDVYDLDDPLPQCCVEGCDCGHDAELRAALRREREELMQSWPPPR